MMKTLLLAVLLLVTQLAGAAPIYTCLEGGQRVYSNLPCAGQAAAPSVPAGKGAGGASVTGARKDSPPSGSSSQPPAISPAPSAPPPQTASISLLAAALRSSGGGISWWMYLLIPAGLAFLKSLRRRRRRVSGGTIRVPSDRPKPAEPLSTAEPHPANAGTSAPADDILPLRAKGFMSRYEAAFFQRLKAALPDCDIHPQIPLAAFIEIDRRKAGKAYYSASYRSQNYLGQKRVDYLVCAPESQQVLAAIELDDPSHETPEAQARDHKKNVSLAEAGIPLFRWRVENPPTVNEIRAAIMGTADGVLIA